LVQPLDTVRDYAESYCAWLLNEKTLFGPEQQDRLLSWLLRDYYLAIRARIIRRLSDLGLSELPWDNRDVVAVTDAEVAQGLSVLDSREDLLRSDETVAAAGIANSAHVIREAFDFVFDDVPRTVASDSVLLNEIPPLLLTKSEPWSLDSTVAFIGYGQAEVFPGHQVVEFTGIVNDTLLADWWETITISQSNRSVVTPFAQSEAIFTFLRAYNSDFLVAAHQRLDATIDEVSGSDRAADSAEQEEFRSAAHVALEEDFDTLSSERFITPMLDTVEALPRYDVARMADALVGVQALRAASGDQQPSVGGPIDVLVISRDHGVEWIRRKNGS
jgi:hypothetical protein